MILESRNKNIAFEKLVDRFRHAAANFIGNMFKHRDGSYMGYLWILFQQLRKRFITSQVAMKDYVRKATPSFTNRSIAGEWKSVHHSAVTLSPSATVCAGSAVPGISPSAGDV